MDYYFNYVRLGHYLHTIYNVEHSSRERFLYSGVMLYAKLFTFPEGRTLYNIRILLSWGQISAACHAFQYFLTHVPRAELHLAHLSSCWQRPRGQGRNEASENVVFWSYSNSENARLGTQKDYDADDEVLVDADCSSVFLLATGY